MEHANNKRSDITLRQSIDGYLAYIQKSFKDAMYTNGSWDEDALSKFCQGVRVTNRGDLLTISSGQKKVHAYIATKNIKTRKEATITDIKTKLCFKNEGVVKWPFKFESLEIKMFS